MPPKKPDPKDKKGGQQQLIDDDYSDLPTLPPLNNYIFSTLYAFKYKKNLKEVQQQILKHYNFPPEDIPNHSKFKSIQREDLINYAKLKQYITEEESFDFNNKVVKDRQVEVLAKTTVDMIMSYEVNARRAKRDNPNMNPESIDVEMTIWLKDFPSNLTEFKALFALKQQIQGVFIIEEKFLQDQEDDFVLHFQSPDPTMQHIYEEEERIRIEQIRKVEFQADERIAIFNDAVEVGKIFKSSTDPEWKMCMVQKIKFEGPDPPMQEEDNEEDKERKEMEATYYQNFASQLREEVENISKDLQEYRKIRKQVKTVPLWPYPEDPLQKQREEEEKRLAELKRLEEEKKQQELLEQQQKAAAQAKGRGAAAKQPPPNSQSRQQLQSSQGQRAGSVMEEQKKEELVKKKPTSRDEEEKEWNFQHLEKILSEITQENGGIGAMMAAMIYQIEQQNANKKQNQLSATDKQFILLHDEQENILGDYFDDMFNKLAIEHNVVETEFKHQFNDTAKKFNSSPYQSLFNENDKVNQLTKAYTFLNGDPISMTENKALQNAQLPGINNRFGMPQQAQIQQPQRESDLNAILSFSPLPPSQTKRCLVLRACEQMMKAKEPERDFFFLDRNFVEKYDSTTLRQQIGQLLRLKPDLCYKYYPIDDALLLAVYFKNPPGRLLRRQWTYPIKTFPEFNQWREFVKKEEMYFDEQNMLDIDTNKVGVLRINSKYCFPSDNSIIRIDKNQIGNRRIGTSLIMKDNMIFGIREKPEVFKQKLGHEDDVVSRETWFAKDRRCDFWLEYENGVKLIVEMVDKVQPKLEEIPLHDPLHPDIFNATTASMKAQLEEAEIAEKPAVAQAEPNPPAQGKSSSLKKNDSQPSLKNPPATQQKQTAQTAQTQQKPGIVQTAPQSTLQKNDSQKSLESNHGPSAQEIAILQKKMEEEQRVMTAQTKQQFFQDNYEPNKGAKLTFTFDSGLIVQVLPNGDVSQSIVENYPEKKKYGGTIQDSKSANQQEKSRIITQDGQVIRYFLDGNMQMFFPDGAITYTDKRKGIWYTVNSRGVKRVRKLQDNQVYDEPKRLKINEKLDPETNATIQVRQDGVLIIKYIDEQRLVMFPDGTQILTRKEDQSTITIISKENYVPVRQIFDPVKARAKTVIGLGGTDSLMGTDTIMERSNNGKITEVLLPDRTIVQTYQERQELEGYNNFMTNMVHLIRRDDYSIIKVRQDGEIVVLTSNQRAYLNSIGKQKEFGKNDYDYFFELFGIPNERRSGVYTANIDQGKIWTQDEEGNVFIIYANGDSVEKLSVSFNLDQMVEGIDKKEPTSPRIKDGEYIEEECKFLPPPKSTAPPRLFMIKNDMGYEFMNQEQLEYFFRCRHKDIELIQSRKQIKIENEDAMSHMFLRRMKKFDAQAFFNEKIPKIPQSVELVNQTVSIPQDPVTEDFLWRNIIEFRAMDKKNLEDFDNTIKRYQQMRNRQQEEKERLRVEEIKGDEHKEMENKVWLRIVKEKGIDVSKVVGEEYKTLKDIVNEERKQKFLDNLEKYFSDDDMESQSYLQ